MLNKTAACLVAFTTTLLFATSEAEVDIEKAKDRVRELLTKLMGTVFEHQAEDHNGLVSAADFLVNEGTMFNSYLQDVAIDGEYSRTMFNKINEYESEFQIFLHDAATSSSQRDAEIPMMPELEKLRTLCKYGPASTSLTADIELSEPFFEIEAEEGIQKEKEQVKLMLDVLLQLVLMKNCNNIDNLVDVANSFLNTGAPLYRDLSYAIPHHTETIMRDIRVYVETFWKVLKDGGDAFISRIPMKDDLNTILGKCIKHSKPKRTIPSDPVVDIISKYC